MTAPDATPEEVCRLRAVRLRHGKTEALAGITLSIPAGRIVGLIGPDGVGKSSLLALMAGAQAVQDGSVRVLHRWAPALHFGFAILLHVTYWNV